jgi:hypothetical protein
MSAPSSDLHRADRREAEVDHARAERVLAGVRVLLEEAEGGKRGHVAVGGAAVEVDRAGQLGDPENRAAGGELAEDPQAALEGLGERRLRHGVAPYQRPFQILEHLECWHVRRSTRPVSIAA